MKAGFLAKQFHYSVICFGLVNFYLTHAQAQDSHAHALPGQQHQMAIGQQNRASALIKIVRESTERFKDVAQAEREHYSLLFGCVSGPDAGAMGLHFLNGDLLNEVNNGGVFDPTRPQIVLYEPGLDGRLRLVGADFLVFADAWDAKHPHDPPQLMGQLFHFFESPNRFGLPAFYTLHVWAWKDNPSGAFVNWHPDVSCAAFSAQ